MKLQLKKYGDAHVFVIPKAFIDTGVFELGQDYELTIEKCSNEAGKQETA